MNFIVALQPEARPLIEGYKLVKRNDSSAFPVFENVNHRLIISGIGRMNAAAATGYLLSELGQPTHAILNLGIAGHGELPTGTPFLANRLLCAEEKTVHYPPPVVDHPITRSALQTCKAQRNLIRNRSDMIWSSCHLFSGIQISHPRTGSDHQDCL